MICHSDIKRINEMNKWGIYSFLCVIICISFGLITLENAKAAADNDQIPHEYGISTKRILISQFDETINGGKSVCIIPEESIDGCFYRWYRCENIHKQNPQMIIETDTKQFETGMFLYPEIRYYYYEVAETEIDMSPSIISDLFIVAYTGLPTVNIDCDVLEIDRENWLEATMRIIPGVQYKESYVGEIQLRGRGNSSWDISEKKSYTLKLSRKKSLFELGSGKKYVLHGDYSDKSLMRNWLASYCAKNVFASKEWVPSYVHVDLVVNGEYQGVYTISEQIRIGDDRVNILSIEDALQNGIVQGGFIIEADHKKKEREIGFTSIV